MGLAGQESRVGLLDYWNSKHILSNKLQPFFNTAAGGSGLQCKRGCAGILVVANYRGGKKPLFLAIKF